MDKYIKLEELVSFAKKGFYYIETDSPNPRIYSVNNGMPLTCSYRNGATVYTIQVDDKYVIGSTKVKKIRLKHIVDGVYKNFTLDKPCNGLYRLKKGLYNDDNSKDYFARWKVGDNIVRIFIRTNSGNFIQTGMGKERYINKRTGSISIRKLIFEYTDFLEQHNCSLIKEPNIVKYKYIIDNELKSITNTFTNEMIIPFKNICTLEGLCRRSVRYNINKNKIILANKFFSFEDKEYACELLQKYNFNLKTLFAKEFNYHGMPIKFKYYQLFKYVKANYKSVMRKIDMYKDVHNLLLEGYNPNQIAIALAEEGNKTEYSRIYARAMRERISIEMEEKY